jgi:outer membrane PBP1 activator LpoA protein
MFEVCDYFTLHATTAHAAAAYLDRLQPSDKFTQKEWQLLAVCCIVIAAKYNECEVHVPDLCTLEDITKQRLPNETVLNYELWILKRMGW